MPNWAIWRDYWNVPWDTDSPGSDHLQRMVARAGLEDNTAINNLRDHCWGTQRALCRQKSDTGRPRDRAATLGSNVFLIGRALGAVLLRAIIPVNVVYFASIQHHHSYPQFALR